MLAANWKMYKSVAESQAWAEQLKAAVVEEGIGADRDLIVAPTHLALWAVATVLADSGVAVAGQTLDLGVEGALTGAVSAYLLRQAGASWVLVGHSERRQHFGEDDALVAEKAKAARHAGLGVILCVGETEAERAAGATWSRLTQQLEPVVARLSPADWAAMAVAYEPVWAIGSGRTPSPEEIGEAAAGLRQWLAAAVGPTAEATRILYGGSVNEQNLPEFWRQPGVDGALVGGASLAVERFLAMARIPLVPGGGTQ
ncbi:MAG: triose-phosphate isomerase [Firmicutes bacterium]|nr:triose-phosphate isomerase [Alicyclobacillaceae bacterium]MCL6498009.1 triose-phosphate isomerase [Bacillota bacterium]